MGYNCNLKKSVPLVLDNISNYTSNILSKQIWDLYCCSSLWEIINLIGLETIIQHTVLKINGAYILFDRYVYTLYLI